MFKQQFRKKLNVYLSLGSILLLVGMLGLFVFLIFHPKLVNYGKEMIAVWYLVCLIIDYYVKNHLLFDQDLHYRLAQSESEILFKRFSQSEIEKLIDWYAQWLALFTGTFGRWCDLCAFQIAGSSTDLLTFQKQHSLSVIDNDGVETLVPKLNLADEQVFKIYYGSRIKQRAFKYLRPMHAYHRQKLQSQYLDQLLDSYGKSYYEYGIFLIGRLRAGEDVRSLYDGLVEYHMDVSNSFVERIKQQKYLIQSSVVSLKDVLQKKKP